MMPVLRRMTQSGWAHLHPEPGRLLVEPRRLHGQVLHREAILGRLGVEEGEGFPA